MQHEITHAPSFGLLKVDLSPGDQVTAEAGAMVARTSAIAMKTTMSGNPDAGFGAKFMGFFVALIRKFVGGETFFVNHFTTPSAGSVWLAPTMSGDVKHFKIGPGCSLVVSTGAYLASSGNVGMKMRWGGLRSLFAREGLFFLELKGDGDVWFNSYGGIESVEINGSYVVDTGHIAGFEGNLDFKIRTAGGGLMGLVASGEGLVAEFQGQGRVYLQTRNEGALVSLISRF